MTKLTIIWFALVLGQVLFLGVTLFMVQGGGFAEGFDGLLEYIAVGALLPMLLMSQVLYKKQIQRALDTNASEDEKLSMYQTANIIKGSLMEGGNIFCITAYLLTGTQWLILPIVAVLGLFFIQRPTVQKFDFEMRTQF